MARLPPGRAGVVLGFGAVLWMQACTGEQVTEVQVGSVTVVPSTVSLVSGEQAQLDATVRDVEGEALVGATPTWSSDDASIATVDASGSVRAVAAGVVAVRATYRDVHGGATVRVIPGPTIAASRDSVAMYAAASASDPRAETVHLTNDGAGALEGLEVTVRQPEGTPPWLTARLASTGAPTSLTLSATTEGLGAGVHRATAVLAAPTAGVGSLEIPVTLGLIAVAVEETGGGTRVAEGGGSDSLLVRLEARPPGDVVLDVRSADTGEVVVEPERLAFGPESWSAVRTVELVGVDDPASDGDLTTEIRFVVDPAASADEVDDLPVVAVAVTTADDDVPALLVAATGAGTIVAESGSTDVVTVRLATRPSSDVVVVARSADPGEATVAPAALPFTPGNWSEARAVTVRGVDDGSADGDQETVLGFAVDPARSDPAYAAVGEATLLATTTDDDRTGLAVVESGGSTVVSEAGTTDALTVALTAQPVTNVVLTVATTDATEASASPASLTFTPADWSQPKTVTVAGVDDPLPDGDVETGVTLTVDPAASDDAYDALPAVTVGVVTVDDDGAGFAVTQSGGSTVVTEDGDTDDVQVVLTAQPASDVVVTVSSADVEEATAAPARLVFTPAGWSVPQTVTVTGVDDFIDDGSQTTTLTFAVDPAASDDAFDAAVSWSVAVTTTDNDAAPGLEITEIGGTSVSEAGSSDDFAVALTAQPATNVVLVVSSADPGEVAPAPPRLTFTSADWSTPRTVTVTGVDDAATDGDQVTAVTVAVDAAASDAAYGAVAPAQIAVTTADDDTAGLIVTEPAGGTVVGENGPAAQVTVALAAQPALPVVVSVTSSDPTEALATPLALTFTSASWSTPQTVTITGIDDFFDDGDQATTITLAVADLLSDDAFDGVPDSRVVVTTTDDDAPAGLTVTNAGGTEVSEAGAARTFTVALASQPATAVRLDVVSADPGEVLVSPPALTFSSAGWSAPQTVTVTGVDDALADGAQQVGVTISVDPSASDPTYAPVSPVILVFTNLDNDTLTFASTTWNTLRNVTVTSVDDAAVGGARVSTGVTGVDATSGDASGVVAGPGVAATTLDDDGSALPRAVR